MKMPAQRDDRDIPIRRRDESKLCAETFVVIKSLASATALNEAFNKFLAKCYFQHQAAHQLIFVDEGSQAVWQNAQTQPQPLQEQVKHIYGDAQVTVGMAA